MQHFFTKKLLNLSRIQTHGFEALSFNYDVSHLVNSDAKFEEPTP